MTTWKDALLSDFLNSKQSSGLRSPTPCTCYSSDLLLFRRNQRKGLFSFIVCHWMVIYHFDLIALITKDSVIGFFFLKGNFPGIPVGELRKIHKASASCIFNCSWVLPMLLFSWLYDFYIFKCPLTLHCVENYGTKTLFMVLCPLKKIKGRYNSHGTDRCSIRTCTGGDGMWMYEICQQAGTEEQSLEMSEQGIITAPEKRRDFTNFNNQRGVRRSLLFSGKHPRIINHSGRPECGVDYFRGKHMLLLSSWLTNAK